MGRFFTSFDEAWQFFLGRDEELEDFFARFPEQEWFFLGWLIRPDENVVPAARDVQAAFSHLDWIDTVPGYVLHSSIAGVAFSPQPPAPSEIATAIERARRVWAGVVPFEVIYRRINCFHDGVVAEVVGDGPRDLVGKLVEAGYWEDLPIDGAGRAMQVDTFLPHMTLGVFNCPHDPAGLRTAIAALRDRELGRQWVQEATLCVIRLSREPAVRPWAWEVVGSVTFDPRS